MLLTSLPSVWQYSCHLLIMLYRRPCLAVVCEQRGHAMAHMKQGMRLRGSSTAPDSIHSQSRKFEGHGWMSPRQCNKDLDGL